MTTSISDVVFNVVAQVGRCIAILRVESFEYLFERESAAWDPEFASDGELLVGSKREASLRKARLHHESPSNDLTSRGKQELMIVEETRGNYPLIQSWKRVSGLAPRMSAREKDEVALRLAAPESGSFILVSLRGRKRHGNAET